MSKIHLTEKQKEKIKRLLPIANNTMIARQLKLPVERIRQLRSVYKIKNPYFRKLTKKQKEQIQTLYENRMSHKQIISTLKLPYSVSGLFFYLKRTGIKHKYIGKPWRKFNPVLFKSLLSRGLSKPQIAKEMGIHEIQMYRYWGKYIEAIK
ncbi:MAG: hypothetical protein Q8K51_02065 [Nitrospirota bacterium]|nr:hypothetical protein [Nitrospirota bacterium]